MDIQSDFTNGVVVDNGRVVMRATTDAPNGEIVTYSAKRTGESTNQATALIRLEAIVAGFHDPAFMSGTRC